MCLVCSCRFAIFCEMFCLRIIFLAVVLVVAVLGSTEEVTERNNVSSSNSHGEHGYGIHVASWRWDEIGLFFTFTLFTIITGLAKVGFHHAHFLSAHIPESCLMILLGLSVGLIIYVSGTPVPDNEDGKIFPQEDVREFAIPTFTNKLFFLILLPPIILESAYSLYDRAFSYNFETVLLYAVVGTLINTFSIGPILYGLSEAEMMGPLGPEDTRLNLLDSLVFSALISAVDPVAVLAIFNEVGVNKDLYYLVFGESLLNDAVTVVLYTTMETFSKMPVIEPTQYGLAVLAFFTVSLGGCAIGVVFGLITALITKTTQDVRVVEPLAVLGLAYLSYLTAELFHFSGIISIIFCGIVQAHYSFKNISQKSYVTVKYFTRMISSTCDAIIFLFLGMVLVNDSHVWHTGFVLWSILLCFICRFIGVFVLTAVANAYRVKPINIQEQFIMAYGGLRGAVAFSLADTLDAEFVKPRREFVTTTLIIILFTVFVQGGTIKLLVRLLHIRKSKSGVKSMNEEINDNVLSVLMAGIEEIAGVRGDYYIRRKFEQLDQCCFNKIFLKAGNESSLKVVFEKLALTEHFAHLYGPQVFMEAEKEPLLRMNEVIPGPSKMLMRSPSVRTTMRFSSDFPDVEIRKHDSKDQQVPVSIFDEKNNESARSSLSKAFRANPFIKMHHEWPDPHTVITNAHNIENQLEMRHMRTLRMSQYFMATGNTKPIFDVTDNTSLVDDVFVPEKDLRNEYDKAVPEELHDVYSVLTRAERRLSRQTSNSSDDSRNSGLNGSVGWPTQVTRENSRRQQTAWKDQKPKQLHDIEEAEHDMLLSDNSPQLKRRNSSSSAESLV